MIHHRQQIIGIRRKVDPHDLDLLFTTRSMKPRSWCVKVRRQARMLPRNRLTHATGITASAPPSKKALSTVDSSQFQARRPVCTSRKW